MTIQEANKWKAIGKLYGQSLDLYISLYKKIQDNAFSFIDNISKEALSSGDLPEYFCTDIRNKNKLPNKEAMSGNILEHVYQIRENIKEIWEKVYETADIYGEMRLNVYKTAGEMYEEIGDLENAAEMYSYSYDYCLDKSMELYEIIAKEQKNDQKN
jgi:hypothetical protein